MSDDCVLNQMYSKPYSDRTSFLKFSTCLLWVFSGRYRYIEIRAADGRYVMPILQLVNLKMPKIGPINRSTSSYDNSWRDLHGNVHGSVNVFCRGRIDLLHCCCSK